MGNGVVHKSDYCILVFEKKKVRILMCVAQESDSLRAKLESDLRSKDAHIEQLNQELRASKQVCVFDSRA